jgi:hypothetical protein
MKMQRRVLFIHLEKTGGTSLTEMFRQLDGVDVRYTSEPVSTELQGFAVVAGHMQADQFMNLLEDYFSFTFIRKPVDRLVSLYRFWASHKDEVVKANEEQMRLCRIAKDHSFKEFIRLSEMMPKCDNPLVRTFCGEKLMASVSSVSMKEFEIALKNMKKLDYVGCYENFDNSCETLFRLLGLENPEILHEMNVEKMVQNGHPNIEFVPKVIVENLDEGSADLLEELTRYDKMLYSYFMSNC